MHYLAKQAARTLALPSGVRPRLPARFDAAPFEPVTPEPVSVEQVIPQPDAPAPAPAAGETPRTVLVENVLRREAERVQTIVERIMPRVEPAPVHEALVETRFVPRVEPPQVQERPRAVEPRIEPQPLPQRQAREREAPTLPRAISDERIVRMIERTETKAVRSEEAVQSAAVAAAAGPPVAPLQTAVPAQKPPVQTRAAERAAQQQARPDDAPPAIHVTIGRIDVRAVMTSEAPAKPAAAAMQPSLSLDDYLKQREGRSR